MPIRRRLKKTPKQYSSASKDSIEDAEAPESDKSVVVVASEHVANIEFGNGVERLNSDTAHFTRCSRLIIKAPIHQARQHYLIESSSVMKLKLAEHK